MSGTHSPVGGPRPGPSGFGGGGPGGGGQFPGAGHGALGAAVSHTVHYPFTLLVMSLVSESDHTRRRRESACLIVDALAGS